MPSRYERTNLLMSNISSLYRCLSREQLIKMWSIDWHFSQKLHVVRDYSSPQKWQLINVVLTCRSVLLRTTIAQPNFIMCCSDNSQSAFFVTSPTKYFAFILFSTTCRSFETGVIASSMGLSLLHALRSLVTIKKCLFYQDKSRKTSSCRTLLKVKITHRYNIYFLLRVTQSESPGVIAASPDFGIVPGSRSPHFEKRENPSNTFIIMMFDI
jgi:hypothetical protein